MKTLILIPTKDAVEAEVITAIQKQTAADCSLLIKTTPRQQLSEDPAKNRLMNIVAARNAIRKEALKSDADWFLWVDSDVVLPPTAVADFLKVGEPVMGAWYQMPNGWSVRPEKTIAAMPKFPIPALHIGFGALMVNREVMKKIEIVEASEEKNEVGTHGKCECLKFCEDAIALGYKPMALPIICKHLKKAPLFKITAEKLETVKKLLSTSNHPVSEVLKVVNELSALPPFEE